MITGDFHMHTAFSADSEADVETMLDTALEKGMETVCITDHWDEDYPKVYLEESGTPFCFDIEKYFEKAEQLKGCYAGQLDVRIGIELGMQPHLGTFYKEMTERYPFDFVIGSVHLIEGKDPYFGELTENHEDAWIYRRALEETLSNLEHIGDFDVLGHIDYVVRYGKYRAEQYSYERFSELLDQILKKVIASGKGIELNTAGWKYGLDFCHPHPDVLKRYRKLGGEIVTVGSDAHKPEHVAYDFKKAEEVLKICGFTYYTQFRNRKPEFFKL